MKNITISGNITRDGELREAGGNKVASFSVAVNGYANKEKTVHYFDCSIWGRRGESAMQFLNKGAKITVTGDLGTREHNGKTYLTVNASDFTPMGGGQKSNDSGGGYGGQQDSGYGSGGSANSGGYGGAGDLGESEIPF